MALHFDEQHRTINRIIQMAGRTNRVGLPSTEPWMDQDWAQRSDMEDALALLDRLDAVVRELHREIVSGWAGDGPLSGSPPAAAPWPRDCD